MSSIGLIENHIYSFAEIISLEQECSLFYKFILKLLKEYYDEIISIISISLLIFLITFLIIKRQSSEERYRRQLSSCYQELKILYENTNAQPLLLRLAFADAVNYDHTIDLWPFCGGVNGSIHFPNELEEPFNAGLSSAIDLLTPMKKKYHRISWADLIQLAGALAVEDCDGPPLDLWYGREDVPVDLTDFSNYELDQYVQKIAKGRLLPITVDDIKGRMLPQVDPPYPLGEQTADTHLRIIANRLGFSSAEMVALCGAHTIGRAFKERSGVCSYSLGDQGATQYTKLSSLAKGDKEFQVGITGGCSWTKNWLKFDNSYFRRPFDHDPNKPDEDLLWLPTDQALFDYPEYRYFATKFANDQELFFKYYQQAHLKMSELGAKFKYRIRLRRLEVNVTKQTSSNISTANVTSNPTLTNVDSPLTANDTEVGIDPGSTPAQP